ncbi:MAG: carbohydrate ABC transporter permease [Ruthenibacterium sp.]
MRFIKKVSAKLHLAMIWPAVALFCVFFILPFFSGVGISLTNWNGFGTPKFVGFANFLDFFKDERALHALYITLLFGIVSPILMNVFGLLYALLLDCGLRFSNIVRAIVYSPAVISSLIMGYIWMLIIKPETGALHQILQSLGLGQLYPDLLSDGTRAIWTIIFVNSWQYIGGSMIVYLAGLQTIPQELKEAAVVDGCGPVSGFFKITLPLLLPSVRINVILNLIGCFSVFDIIMALTSGGPGYSTESLSIFIYRMCYGSSTGYSTAVALILFVLILVPVAASTVLLKKKEVEW